MRENAGGTYVAETGRKTTKNGHVASATSRDFALGIASGCFEVVAYLRELAAGRVNNQGKRDGANPIGKPAETNIEARSSYPARV